MGVDPLDPLMAGLGTFQSALKAVRLPYDLGEVGLHGRELLTAADQGAGVQLAVVIQRDGHHRHVWGGLVAVDDGREDVFGPMPGLEPVQRIPEIGVLLIPVHGLQRLGRSADEVFQPMHGIGSDLFRGAGAPGIKDGGAVGPADQNRVVDPAGRIGVRGLAFAKRVLKAGAHVAEGLDLGAAQDRKASAWGGLDPAADGAPETQLVIVLEHHEVTRRVMNVYSLDILPNIARPAKQGKDTFITLRNAPAMSMTQPRHEVSNECMQ